jgi:hypothetical protein
VAVVELTSTISGVHISFGHVGVGGRGGGGCVVMLKTNCPLRGVGSGPVLPATVTAVSCPGATLPPGFVHSTDATPSASIVISNVVPPRPATLPVHVTCAPMSVHTGAPAPFSMKWPLCA